MDGYAVRDADLDAFPGVAASLSGESFAGSAWSGDVEAGTCVRIFTGAPMPPGADRVVIQEDVRRERRYRDHRGYPRPGAPHPQARLGFRRRARSCSRRAGSSTRARS